jgi:hypothetical protein
MIKMGLVGANLMGQGCVPSRRRSACGDSTDPGDSAGLVELERSVESLLGNR